LFNREADLIIKNKEDEELMKLSEKEKEKTIKCLLKVLQLQVKQVEVQAGELID
jgi:hypothetical protein